MKSKSTTRTIDHRKQPAGNLDRAHAAQSRTTGRALALLLAASGLLLAGCVTRPEGTAGGDSRLYAAKPVRVEHGKASWYAGRWIGRKTANGERYHRNDITAAHKTLPFNTRVRVINLENGKSVIVRINNRGPFIRGRIIDLSIVAARRIDMVQRGVVPVRVEVLREIPVLEQPNIRRASG